MGFKVALTRLESHQTGTLFTRGINKLRSQELAAIEENDSNVEKLKKKNFLLRMCISLAL